MTNMPKVACYSVRFYIVVDHPELRNPGMPMLAPGTRISEDRQFRSFNYALSFLDEIRAGQWDFESEYVSAANMLRVYEPEANRMMSPTIVRRGFVRARNVKVATFSGGRTYDRRIRMEQAA